VYHEGTFLSAVPGKAPQSAEPVVPKLLHQTWKDDQLPEMVCARVCMCVRACMCVRVCARAR